MDRINNLLILEQLSRPAFTSLVAWLLLSCGCPADIKLGEIHLMKPQFLLLSGTESMTYTNANTGETLILRGEPMEYTSEKLFMASLCSKPPLSSQYSFYECTPFASKRYKSSGMQYVDHHYNYKTFSPVQGDTTSSFDLLTINGPNIWMNILVSDRGKPTVYSSPIISGRNQSRIVTDTTINNQRFHQVYCQVINSGVCFTPSRGVIAFYRSGAWWFQTGFK